MYKVIQTIQGKSIDAGEPVEVQYYKGPSLAAAMKSLIMAAAIADEEESSPYYTLVSVRMEVIEDGK